MLFRRVMLLLHLWAGLFAGVFLLLLGATGSFMVYERQIDHVLNGRLVHVEPAGQALSLSELFARLEKAHPGYRVTEIGFSKQPDLACEVYLDPGNDTEGKVVTVSPYSAEELGDARSANTFVNSVHQFHTHLLMTKNREAGKWIVGIASVFLLFLSCSGIILWWRRKLITIHWRASGKRINFDLHNALGVLSSLFLFCFALTGVALTWDDATSKLVNRLTHSSEMPGRPRMPASPEGASALGPDALEAAARAALPGARLDSFSMDPGRPVDVRMQFPEDRTPAGRSRVFLDPFTGNVLSAWSTRTAPLGFKISRLWIREIHTGDIFGWPTQILACVISLLLPLLAITGILIWWNRGRKLLLPAADEAP